MCLGFAIELQQRLGFSGPPFDLLRSHLSEALELFARVLVLASSEEPSCQIGARGGKAGVDPQGLVVVARGLIGAALTFG